MDIFDQIITNLKNTTDLPFTFETTNVTGLVSFLKTIDWSERWLIGLGTFHLIVTMLVFLSRRSSNFQIGLFFLLLTLCYFAEKINELGARYWNLFALEQYFDSNGLFISVVFSAPLILNCSIIVVFWLYESYLLLVKVVKMKKTIAKKNKDDKENRKNINENVETKKAK